MDQSELQGLDVDTFLVNRFGDRQIADRRGQIKKAPKRWLIATCAYCAIQMVRPERFELPAY